MNKEKEETEADFERRNDKVLMTYAASRRLVPLIDA